MKNIVLNRYFGLRPVQYNKPVFFARYYQKYPTRYGDKISCVTDCTPFDTYEQCHQYLMGLKETPQVYATDAYSPIWGLFVEQQDKTIYGWQGKVFRRK